MTQFKRIQELPSDLRRYTQIVLVQKSLEGAKEEQKAAALAALQRLLPQGVRSLFAVSRRNVVLLDINPQSHALFDPQDDSPEIRGILAAQREVAQAQSRLNAAIAAGKNAGKVHVTPQDSIRLEVLTPAKLAPVLTKYAARIRALRRPSSAPDIE